MEEGAEGGRMRGGLWESHRFAGHNCTNGEKNHYGRR